MRIAFRDIVPIVNPWPTAVGHGLTMGTMSLKAIPIYSSKWCIVLQTDFYNLEIQCLISGLDLSFSIFFPPLIHHYELGLRIRMSKLIIFTQITLDEGKINNISEESFKSYNNNNKKRCAWKSIIIYHYCLFTISFIVPGFFLHFL